jgi:hypothetical protein
VSAPENTQKKDIAALVRDFDATKGKNRGKPPLDLTAPKSGNPIVGVTHKPDNDQTLDRDVLTTDRDEKDQGTVTPEIPDIQTDLQDEALFASQTKDLSQTARQAPVTHEFETIDVQDKATEDKSDLDTEFDFVIPPPLSSPPVKRPEKRSAAIDKSTKPKATKALKPVITPVKSADGIIGFVGGSALPFWGGVAFMSALWVLGVIGFSLGAQSGLTIFDLTAFKVAILALVALLPVGLIYASALALRQAAALAGHAARASDMAQAMLAPAVAATHNASQLVDQLKQQVESASLAMNQARSDLDQLGQRLRLETQNILATAQTSQSAAQAIGETLSQERTALARLSENLDQKAQAVIHTVERQARMVAEASDLAQTQLREAEAALAARAADLATTAADAHNTARTLSEDLGRQTLRLETAGSGVADQIRVVEDGLSQQRAGLISTALSLRADQEDFAVHIENQRTQLAQALSLTRTATVDLGETSSRGVDVLRDIVLSAQEHFRQVMNAAEHERTVYETRIYSTLSNISIMAADARDELVQDTKRALEVLSTTAVEARQAAEQASQSAQMRVDRLAESLFIAGKKADENFDLRLSAARRLIEESADLVSEAGDQTALRLDETFARTHQALEQVRASFDDINTRAEHLPAFAQERILDIRRSVEDGISAMTMAARQATVETEAVDYAFQERVKRNYEMLNEAARLMGVLSGGQPLSKATASLSEARPQAPPHIPATRPEAAKPDMRPQATPQQDAPPTLKVPMRPARLRLTPLTEPLSPEFRPAQAPQRTAPPSPNVQVPLTQAPLAQDGWSWRDLLNGIEGQPDATSAPIRPAEKAMPIAQYPIRTHPPETNLTEPQFDNLDDLIIAQLSNLGIDIDTILSRSRIEETLGLMLAEDFEGARLLVRRIAPAAVRRLTRRLMSDTDLREKATDFVSYYDQQINMALMSKAQRQALFDVLHNDTGRAYMICDAAISDII